MYRRAICSVAVIVLFACSPVRESSDDKVRDEWAKRELVVYRALNKKGYEDLEYVAACRFFQKLTGIEIKNDITPEGLMPTTQAQQDFSRIKEWYKKNHDNLCWNGEVASIELCPDEEMLP